MPTATQVLLEEHRRIRAVVDPAIALAPSVADGWPSAPAESRQRLEDFASLLVTDLAHHAAKEDNLLFPAIEAVLGSPFGPIAVMRQEHQQIHAAGARFRQALAESAAPSATAQAAELAASLSELGALIAEHFHKEEAVLFPMADAHLPPEQLLALGDRLLAFTDRG